MKKKNEFYVIVEWPEVQMFMDKEGFDDNACPISDEFYPTYLGSDGEASYSGAYFVNYNWLEKQKREAAD